MSPSSSVSRPAFGLSFALALSLSLALVASASLAATLELNDGTAQSAKLLAISAGAVTVEPEVPAGESVVEVPMSGLYRWGEPVKPAARPLVELVGGSRLVAAPTWTLEGSVRLVDNRLTVRQMLLEDLTTPRSAVGCLLFEATRDPAYYAAIVRQARTPAAGDDRVWLTSGDAFSGRVESITGGRLTLSVGEQQLEFGLGEVVAVRLASESRSPSPPKVAVGLRDGGLLLATEVELTEAGALSVTLADGAALQLSGRRPGVVTLVQPLSGGVTYLSDLEPLDYRHTPYFDLAWGWARDENLLGGPLQSRGGRWLKGLAMHSAARLVYRIAEPAERFVAEVAIDDSALGGSEALPSSGDGAVFRVLVARGGRFAEAWASPVVRPGGEPLPVSVDVSGAQAIALLVDYGDTGDTRDHADWLGARLIKAAPPAE